MRRRICALALVTLFGAAPTPAPSPSPTPNPCAGLLAELNRPTTGYSTCTAPQGSAIAELGYQNLQLGPRGTSTTQVEAPQSFLRYGATPRLELDVFGPTLVMQRGALGNANGFDDTGLGFKYEFLPSQRWQVGVDGLYTPPNGALAFTAGNATYTGNLDTSYQLTPTTSLASTLAFSSTGGYSALGAHGRYGTFMPSALVLQQVNAVTQMYVEYVNVSRTAPDAGDSAFMDTGLQRLVGSHVEIDVEYGDSVSGLPSQRFTYIGAGCGVLLP